MPTKTLQIRNSTADNISLHLKNIFADKELYEISVTKDFLVTAEDFSVVQRVGKHP